MNKKIAILGSTGSIGTQSLDVISHYPELFTVEALAAGNNITLLQQQIEQFKPKVVSVANKSDAETLRGLVPTGTKVYYGEEGLLEAAASTDANFVIAALIGSLGLKSTIAAIKEGKDIGLANKETLVTAGHLVTSLAKQHQVRILPIDSEHSAIFQCLHGENIKEVSKIIITASGGSFRDKKREELVGVTVEQALKHPNWSMGAKITIDSATMVNKGLEVIEAHWLFDLPYEQIDVILHPESIIHSLVEFSDHSVLAQLGTPDMRVPIQYALTYPQRLKTPASSLNLLEIGDLHFRKMDFERFPCLRMAYESGKLGGSAPTVFNASNEIAVDRFLKGKISFLQIESIIEQVINLHEHKMNPNLAEIVEIDQWARDTASSLE